jgi:hypothetical protein
MPDHTIFHTRLGLDLADALARHWPTSSSLRSLLIEQRARLLPDDGQYRAKAAEFGALLTITPRSPSETSELRNLEQTYRMLAENEEWVSLILVTNNSRGQKLH